MAKYFLTNKAIEDLTEIWNYTFDEWSEQQADKYYQLLIDNCKEIALNPKLGKNYDDILTTLHGLKVAKHIIFYRILGSDKIEITRILHERMDLRSRIKE
ncbi:MAG: type II toxin-antitoxin system RelE/ParE family toxin [Prolixibacteraceae bacterium]|nr:type II toxin-antitoxin system RelE/ParE family toxin [Prolixibacteraceae bacterium]